MAEFQIGKFMVGDGHPTFIIAEIGINHQGKESIAREMIHQAAECGVNCVKFQKRTIDRILTREALDRPYTGPTSYGATYGEHRRNLELSEEAYYRLKETAEREGMAFLASAWDEEAADFLDALGVEAYKMASADLINIPLIEHIARKGRPIILSTGMSTDEDVDRAVAAVRKHTMAYALLQCCSAYPCSAENINLRVIPHFKEKHGCVVGYSGHERGIAISTVAVAMGAQIVERHFTLDRTMRGSDHAASLEPPGLHKLVRDIRTIEKAMGAADKTMQEEEIPLKGKLAKSVATATALAPGVPITEEMLTIKGPGTGIAPWRISEVIGRKPTREIPADKILTEEDIDWTA